MNKKILAIGRYNCFVSRSISELSKHCNLDAIVLIKGEDVNLSHEVKNIKIISIINFIGIIKFYYYIYKIRNNYDAVIFYYFQDYFFALLFLNIIKIPKYYFPFGSDLHKIGIKKLLLKKSLEKFNKIFIELETQKQYIIDNYKVLDKQVETSLIIFNVDSCFQLIDKEQKGNLIKKWNINKRYVIFSPRSVTELYNHHLIVEGISHLNNSLKDNIQLIIIGTRDDSYAKHIVQLGEKFNIDILHINNYITPEEMAEIFNISHININIPKQDHFGHSIIEGCLCGTVPLLSDKISNYRELMKENTNCIYTNEIPYDIANKIVSIINDFNNIKDKLYKNNFDKLSSFTKKEENAEAVVKYIYRNISIDNKGGSFEL